MRPSPIVNLIICLSAVAFASPLSTLGISHQAFAKPASSAPLKPAPLPVPSSAPSTKPPYNPFRILAVIFLSAHDTYLAARAMGDAGSQYYASNHAEGPWEKFKLVYLENGKVAIQTWTNSFLTLPGNGNGWWAINSVTLNEEQLFDMIDNQDGTWSFRSVVFGNFLNVRPGTSDKLVQSSINKGPWARLRVLLA